MSSGTTSIGLSIRKWQVVSVVYLIGSMDVGKRGLELRHASIWGKTMDISSNVKVDSLKILF